MRREASLFCSGVTAVTCLSAGNILFTTFTSCERVNGPSLSEILMVPEPPRCDVSRCTTIMTEMAECVETVTVDKGADEKLNIKHLTVTAAPSEQRSRALLFFLQLPGGSMLPLTGQAMLHTQQST